MKHLKKILAIFLIVLTIISMCSAAMPVFAENRLFSENNEIDEFDIPEDDYVEPEIISEITEKREENVKHFLLSDGSFMVAKYNNPVHYQNNDGMWIDIDNTMSKTIASAEQIELFGTDELYITNNAIENVVFAEKSNSNTLVSYEAKDYPISLNYQSAKKSKIKIIENEEVLVGNDSFLTLPNISQEVIYEDVFSGVDLQYIVGSNKIKENIIIKNKSAQNTFTVNYNIGELEAKVLDERTINLVAGENTVYTITAPYMCDANGTVSNDITLNVNKNKNGKLRVVITADSEWLTDESRNYPIVIDPSIVEFSATELSSTYVSSTSATENYNENRDELRISNNDGTYGTSYALFELENVEKNIYADHIVSAELKLPLNTTLSSSNRVYMYEITSDWDASTVNWNTKPSISNIKTDYCNLTTTSKSMSFDITKLYYQWTETENVNGVALKLNDTGVVSFKAEDEENPILILKYISTVGVDEDFSYTEFDMGSAGYVYVNNLSGNLVLTRDEFDTTGENHSYDFTKTYNSLGCVSDSEPVWFNSYDSTIFLGVAYLDTDGSAEILTSTKSETDESIFIVNNSEFGWEKLKLIDYIIKTFPLPGGNSLTFRLPNTFDAWCNGEIEKYRFNMGGLIEQSVLENGVEKVVFLREPTENADGTNNSNKFYLVDGDGDKIEVSITDTSVTYTQRDYKDANDFIIGDVLVYYKDSNGNITQIKLNEKVQAEFTYDTFNRMISVENDAGYKLTFSYEGEGKKIASITESKNGEQGQYVSFARTYNSMKARSAGSDGLYGNEDDLITTYKFNNEAKLLSIQNATVAGEDLGASMYDYDNNIVETDEDTETDTVGGLGELTQVSSIGKNVENLLKNHNLESLDSWQSRYAAGTGSEYTAVATSSKHLYGANSFELSVEDLNGNAAIAFTQEFSASSGVLVPGKTYTLSAYVNANGLSRDNNVSASNGFGAAVMFEVTSTSGQKTRTYSRSVQSTNSQVNGGWERVFLNITIPDTYSKISANLVLRNATGTAYFDAAQLEIGDIPNQYNLIENNGFNYTNSNGYATNWTRYNLESSDTIVNGKMKFVGNPDNKKAVYQDIVIGDSSQNENYVYGGWVTANAVPKKTGRHLAIYPIVYYKDSSGNESRESKKFTYFDFYDLEEQYASGTVSLAHSTDDTLIPFKIRILVCYYRECNTAIFDKICLYRSNDVYDLTDEEENNSYVYDANGNLSSYTDDNGVLYNYTYYKLSDGSFVTKTETITETKTVNDTEFTDVTIYEYNTDGDLIKETTPDNKVYNYTYDNEGNLLSGLTASGIGDRYTYNANGDVLTESYEDGTSHTYTYDANGNLTYETSVENGQTYWCTYTYDSLDNLLTKVDSKGKTNTYTYVYYDMNHDGVNDKSAIATESLEDGSVNTYTYSDYNKLIRQTTTKDGTTLAYNYDTEGKLIKVEHNGFEYKYEYDAFGNITSVKVGNQSLINYIYQADKSKLSSELYGNGSQINYTYTPYGKVKVKNSVGLGAVTTKYDALGNIIYENDEPAGTKTYYEYDAEGRLAGETVTSSSVGITGNNFLYSSFDVFDSDGNITNNTIKTQHTFTTNYTFANNLPSQTKMTSTRKVDFTYDEHDKLLARTLTTNIPVVETFDYNEKNFVSTHIFTHGTDTDIVYSYSYDDNGNITEIKKNNVVQQSYVYDANSQLIRENNLDLNKTIVYTYDNGGNIVSKKAYAYTTGTPTTLTDTNYYSYDSAWKNKLTSYDGQSISYDAIGNPTNYMGATMTWFARQMQSYSKGNTNITYKYDSDGLRTQKVVNGVEHNYYYVDGQLRYEKYGDSYEIYYNYDAAGRPCRAYKKDLIAGKNYSYYLITNTRGDVVETRDGDGNVNARFVYDSWGKLISVTDGSGNSLSVDSFAYQISLKYRGYVYDNETGLYYLESRYYDPGTGRFLNVDDVVYIGAGSNIMSYNAFAYCENNPICKADALGSKSYYVFSKNVSFESIALKLINKSKWKNPNILCSYSYWYSYSNGRKYGVFYNYYTQYASNLNYRQVERIFFKTYIDWMCYIDLENCNIIKLYKNTIRKNCGFTTREINDLIDFLQEHVEDDFNLLLESYFNVPISLVSQMVNCAEFIIDMYYTFLSSRTKHIKNILNEIHSAYKKDKYLIFIPLDIIYQQAFSWSITKWKTYKTVRLY